MAANETIRINQAVAEYTGRVMMVEEFDRSNRSERFDPSSLDVTLNRGTVNFFAASFFCDAQPVM